ncbi:DUF1622 domain-containing protein [Methanogenium sp. S4BF]|uniref:DUF1622 domain-containing protein n=1 Tax=Methanogenium sp. S4BF TaxID=1789226 RepID=UPI002418049E|nr:DUF1622 domain-containing protein [Methanogenium sp. S4BF]WFN34481.1 DUF1622 domain-containing protein [Methanogenium sp. S4BF]
MNILAIDAYAGFFAFLQILTFFFEIVGAALIVYGGIKAAYLVILLEFRKIDIPYNRIRMNLTSKIVFGLEFLIAADILATIIAPTQEELLMLAVVVVIRTVLGYFLEKEALEFKIT